MGNQFDEIREGFKQSRFSEFIGLQLDAVSEGKVTLSLPYQTSLENMQQTVHGGVYATVLDTVMGLTCRSLGYDAAITIQMSIQFLKPVRQGTIYADASIISHNNKTMLVEGRLYDEDKNLIAHSTGNFRVIKHENK